MIPSLTSLAIAAGLAALVLAVFAQTSAFQFVSIDDPVYVQGNGHVLGGLHWHNVTWAFTSFDAGYWIPLTWLSYMLDVSLGGPGPSLMHVTNLVLHLANTLLVFAVLTRATGDRWPGALVAALFAVHPLHVESVAWITERKDVLSGLFFWLALWNYVSWVRRPATARYALVALWFVCGLMAKGMVVTLPFVLVLADVWPLRRLALEGGLRDVARRAWPLVREKLPLFAIAAAGAVVTYVAQRGVGAVNTLGRLPADQRLTNVLVSYVAYLWKTIWPRHLAVFYVLRPASAVLGTACLLLLVAVTAAIVREARRRPYLLVGWLWYLGMLVPVIGLVQVGDQAMADRFTYLPLAGVFIAIAWGAADAARVVPRRAIAAAGVVAVLVCAIIARAQAATWSTSEALWRHAIEADPNDYLAEDALGSLLSRERPAEAIAHFQRAIAIRPFARAQFNLGLMLANTGRPRDAIREFRAAIATAAPHDPTAVAARDQLGRTLAYTGDTAGAVTALEDALRLDPANAATHRDLGSALFTQGRLEEAQREYAAALRLRPDDLETYQAMGTTAMAAGREDEAIRDFSEVIRLRPDVAAAWDDRGVALGRQGRLADAIRDFSEAVRLQPTFELARLHEAAVLAAAGHPDEAATQLRAVLAQDPSNNTARQALVKLGKSPHL